MRVRITATREDEIEAWVEVDDGTPLDPTDDRWKTALYEQREHEVVERHFTIHDLEAS